MNKIIKQQGPTCQFAAVLNARETAIGIKPSAQLAKELFDERYKSGRAGLVWQTLDFLKKKEIIQGWEKIYSGDDPKPRSLPDKFWSTLAGQEPRQALIMGIKYYERRLPIHEGTHEFEKHPHDLDELRKHMVHPYKTWIGKSPSNNSFRAGAKVEDSKSADWGDQGYFYMPTPHYW